jgi:hypothetical protein
MRYRCLSYRYTMVVRAGQTLPLGDIWQSDGHLRRGAGIDRLAHAGEGCEPRVSGQPPRRWRPRKALPRRAGSREPPREPNFREPGFAPRPRGPRVHPFALAPPRPQRIDVTPDST